MRHSGQVEAIATRRSPQQRIRPFMRALDVRQPSLHLPLGSKRATIARNFLADTLTCTAR